MRLRAHDVKPTPKFRGNGEEPYYLGLELEMVAPSYEKRDEGLELSKRPRHFYAKQDGSIGPYGWELVTMPIGKSMWLNRSPKERDPIYQLFALVNDLKSMGYTSHDNGYCGLHIHICRKAFGESLQTGNHYYWFSRLINGPLFRKLSQRSNDAIQSWTRQISGWDYNHHTVKYTGSRYKATNITNRTVEIRIFRGNMRENRIRKNVESVIAATEFARERMDLPACEESPDTAFRLWVDERRGVYPNLAAYLDTIDLPMIAPTEEVEPQPEGRSPFCVA